MLVLPSADLAEALRILREGGVVAHATETCYGFACDLTNPDAVSKLFALKKRAYDQPVSALFASVEEAKNYVVWNDRAEELAGNHLPGPLTLILGLNPDAPFRLFPTPPPAPPKPAMESRSPRSLGIRVSSHPLATELARAFGKPLSTTSANLHGLPSPYDAEEIFAQFRTEPLQPDVILDSGRLPPNPPSTVIDVSGGKGNQTKRRGSVLPS